MRRRSPWVSGSLVLVALVLLSGVAQAASFGTWRWGSTSGKIVNPVLARAVSGDVRTAAPGGVIPSTGSLKAPKPDYTCVPSCDQLTMNPLPGSGDVVGLSSTGGNVTVTGVGYPIFSCVNNGQHQPPAKTPFLASGAGTTTLDPNTYSKGKATPSVFALYTPTQAEYDAMLSTCPNPKTWTVAVTGMHWIQVRLTVLQDDGTDACKVFTFLPGVLTPEQELRCP